MTASRFRVILYTIAEIVSLVAILGSESEIYFYAHQHSATSYIYTLWTDGASEVCRANAA